METFCCYIGKQPQQIIQECDSTTDREFRRKYSRYLRNFIGIQRNNGYADGSVKVMISVIKSFFRYNDLPLGHIPVPRDTVTYHNRDITKKEIAMILSISTPRDKAFFAMMCQSGLRPSTLCKLQLKHIELDRLEKEEYPIKIQVPKEYAKGKFRSYFTFIGEEAGRYFIFYLSTRQNLTQESLLFTVHGHEHPITRRTMSNRFRAKLRTLKAKKLIEYEDGPKGKPRQLRLYNLRKFFRKFSNQAGFEFVQYWMGHIVRIGQEEHYRPKDVEFHRELYKENAMPFLRLETSTPSETEQTIMELRKQLTDRDREVAELHQKIESLSGVKRLAEVLERSNSVDEFFTRFKRLKDKEFETS